MIIQIHTSENSGSLTCAPTLRGISRALSDFRDGLGAETAKLLRRDENELEVQFGEVKLLFRVEEGELKSASLFDEVEEWALNEVLPKARGARDRAVPKESQRQQPRTKREDIDANKRPQKAQKESTREDYDELLSAAITVDEKSIRRLAARGVRDKNYQYSSPALRHAVKAGATSLVRYLLDTGSNPNVQWHGWDDYGTNSDDAWGTPLSIATKAGFFEIVSMLLDAGAELDKDTWYHKEDWTHLALYATESGHGDLLSLLLSKGVAPNSPSVLEHYQPLVVAAKSRRIDLARILVAAGGNPWLNGGAAIKAAEAADDTEMVKLLKAVPGRIMTTVREKLSLLME